MFTELVELGGAALSLIENRKSILKALRRFRRRILGGTWRVPVFGTGGAGKTTLGRFIAGQLDIAEAVQGYRETLRLADFSLPGDVPCSLLVVPGQKRRRADSWQALYRLLSAGKVGGVINVVSYGHHSSDLEHSLHRAFKAGMTDDEFRSAYFEMMRMEELEALREIVPHLIAAPGKLWMITLVTKQDLWWDQRFQVRDYYENGEYQKSVREILDAKGSEHFTHNYFSISLIPQNLVTNDGKVLAMTTAGYDQAIRVANVGSFVAGLSELIR